MPQGLLNGARLMLAQPHLLSVSPLSQNSSLIPTTTSPEKADMAERETGVMLCGPAILLAFYPN